MVRATDVAHHASTSAADQQNTPHKHAAVLQASGPGVG
jgi:hypothetical protein